MEGRLIVVLVILASVLLSGISSGVYDCGNELCDIPDENNENCPHDCWGCNIDDYCDTQHGETWQNCYNDCTELCARNLWNIRFIHAECMNTIDECYSLANSIEEDCYDDLQGRMVTVRAPISLPVINNDPYFSYSDCARGAVCCSMEIDTFYSCSVGEERCIFTGGSLLPDTINRCYERFIEGNKVCGVWKVEKCPDGQFCVLHDGKAICENPPTCADLSPPRTACEQKLEPPYQLYCPDNLKRECATYYVSKNGWSNYPVICCGDISEYIPEKTCLDYPSAHNSCESNADCEDGEVCENADQNDANSPMCCMTDEPPEVCGEETESQQQNLITGMATASTDICCPYCGIRVDISKKYIDDHIEGFGKQFYTQTVTMRDPPNKEYILAAPFDPIVCSANIFDKDVVEAWKNGKRMRQNIFANIELIFEATDGSVLHSMVKNDISCGSVDSSDTTTLMTKCRYQFNPQETELKKEGWPRAAKAYCKITPYNKKERPGVPKDNKDRSNLLVARYNYYFMKANSKAIWYNVLEMWRVYAGVSEINRNEQSSGKPVFVKQTWDDVSGDFMVRFYGGLYPFLSNMLYLNLGPWINDKNAYNDDKIVVIKTRNYGGNRGSAGGDPYLWVVELEHDTNDESNFDYGLAHEMGHGSVGSQLCDEYKYLSESYQDECKNSKNKFPAVCKATLGELEKSHNDLINWIKGGRIGPSPFVYIGTYGRNDDIGYEDYFQCPGTPFITKNFPDPSGSQITSFIKETSPGRYMINYPYLSVMGVVSNFFGRMDHEQNHIPIGINVYGAGRVYPMEAKCPLRGCGSASGGGHATGDITFGKRVTSMATNFPTETVDGGASQNSGSNISLYEISLRVDLTDYSFVNLTSNGILVGIENLSVNNYTVNLQSIRRVDGVDSDFDLNSSYTNDSLEVRLLDENNSVLFNYYIKPEFGRSVDCFSNTCSFSPQDFISNSIIVHLDLPYYNNVKYLKVFLNSEEKMSVTMDELCNHDGNCSGFENYYSCPSDCPMNSSDGVCVSVSGDDICDPDCLFDSDCSAFCSDGIKDGNEQGVDCGGVCNACRASVGLFSYFEYISSWLKGEITAEDLLHLRIT